jgi:hypothetical protein
LGGTGLRVGRLGVAASYGVPSRAVEQAFERGVNYLYWGSRRTGGFGQAIRNLSPQRDRMVLVIQSYSRIAALVGPSLERALREVKLDYADILLLGLWNKPVAERIFDAARKLKDRGLVRFLALSPHDRPLLGGLAAARTFDVLHFRYNAIHPGAESDIFPHIPAQNRPGMVAYTATSWKQLPEFQETRGGRKGPGGGRLLSVRALAFRGGRLHDRSLRCRADGGSATGTRPGSDVRSRACLDAACRRREARLITSEHNRARRIASRLAGAPHRKARARRMHPPSGCRN